MARRSTGQVVTRKTKRGTVYALRFYAGGERHYLTLGTSEEGMDRRKAEDELAATMAAVRAGTWKPPKPTAPVERTREPTFHEFASEWLAAREGELRPKTIKDYRWALSYHLLPYFKDHRLTAITAEEVDRFKSQKVREGKIAPAQVNKCLKRLAQILDVAVDYGHIPANPAASKGGRRRVKAPPPRRTWVEPEQLLALLDAAPAGSRPLLATLAGAGLRVGEACALDWRDVDLATGTLRVGEAKTDAGAWRQVDLPLGLADELRGLKASSPRSGPSDAVFLSGLRDGRRSRQTPDNVGRRLKTAIRRANQTLAELSIEPINERVSPHSLRRTYASLRFALGDDPIYVAEQGGWSDPAFPMRVYAKAVRRRERLSGEHRKAFEAACEWATIAGSEKALMGTSAGSGASTADHGGSAISEETAV